MNNDLISREALKKAFRNNCLHNCYYCNLAKWDKKGSRYNCGLIDNAPTVDTYTIEDIKEVQENSLILGAKLAQRPQGEWKFIQGATTQGSLKCPFCDYRDYHKTNSNFCPNCGADMRKGGAKND